MPVSIHNVIEIAVSAEQLFNYVTKPWLWHEWHPNSKSAQSAHRILAAGDAFDEVIEVKPLAPLPLRMTRRTAYTVTRSEPFQAWETMGRMKDGWVRIRYDFEEKGSVTFFSRTLDFDVTGLTRVLLPLLKSRMEKQSMVALHNLKTKMQERSDES
ncbi:MAG: SRPBCC family protein [Xanthomonadales bacterium]|nr:SRPBCC family protein [Gammaproteobacteria bacterium]MBT8052934.1 SRPBCC family protein [Gammaproteobacteria bacterium]NND57826.1 SRPBCC family protein [Xanthomonadales bacterium]NNK50705.1 SRPBCC family protein [Xanthomonadales bacterium]